MKNIASFLALVASLSYVIEFASGHSWVEQLTLVASNGTFVGEPGYSRGYVPRDSDFEDKLIVHLIPPAGRENKFLPTDNICRETQRTPDDQTEESPRLKATPGAVVALRYQENGHVTNPDDTPGKPDNRGYVYVYGTTDPRPDDKLLAIHKVWTSDGTGGDGRGLLLSQGDYDDGRCYQINDKDISMEREAKFKHQPSQLMGADIWCQQDIALPVNAPTGKPYTLYWVWDWPTVPKVAFGLTEIKQELYTTCMDIDIVPDNELGSILKATEDTYIEGQDLNRAAIPEQMASLNLEIRIPDATTGDPTDSEVTQTPDVRVQDATIVAPSQTTLATSILTPEVVSQAGIGKYALVPICS